MLPPGSQWVLVVDPSGVLNLAQLGRDPGPGRRGRADTALPPTPPVGVGARLSEAGLTIQTVIPVQFMENVGNLLVQGRK